MNFNLKPPKGYIYAGDVNLEYGGIFYTDVSKELYDAVQEGTPYDEWVDYVSVNEYSLQDKQWVICAGKVHIVVNEENLHNLLRLAGEKEKEDLTPGMLFTVAAVEGDTETECCGVVQIGKLDAYSSSRPKEPDWTYRGNAKLHNIVKEWL